MFDFQDGVSCSAGFPVPDWCFLRPPPIHPSKHGTSAVSNGVQSPIGRDSRRNCNPDTRKGATLKTGTVKWFNGTKGYGFLAQDGGEDVFVHFSAIQGGGYRDLQEGQRVEFEVMNDPRGKGLRAANVVVL